MTRLITLAFLLTAGPLQAACYADYKAKQDAPLRLHYGVAELRGECSLAAAQEELAQRLSGTPWQLLSVESVFGDEGLEARREDAGQFFLRY